MATRADSKRGATVTRLPTARNSDTGRSSEGVVWKANPEKFRLFSVRAGMDLPFFFLVLTLMVIGLIMLFSSSYAYAYYNYGNSYYFIIRQAGFAVAGIFIMVAISYFDYHHLHKLAIPILLVTYMLLVLVLFMPERNGVRRWIYLGRSISSLLRSPSLLWSSFLPI